MKRISKVLGILMAVAMILSLLPSIASAEISNYDTNDFNKLQQFLNLPSGIANKTNGKAISSAYDPSDPDTWAGVSWTDSNPMKVRTIGVGSEWQSKLLSGRLDLSGFTELTTLHVTGNRITELVLTGDNKLTDVGYTNNHTSNISYEHNGGYVYISSYGNGYVGFYTRYNEYNEVQVVGIAEPEPSYGFFGWGNYSELAGEDGRLYLDVSEYTTHNAKAHFKTMEVPYYTVRFNLMGGEHMGGGELVQYVAEHDSAELPTTIRAGYYLTDWDEDNFNITGDITISAIWEADGSYPTPEPTVMPEPTATPTVTPEPTVTPVPTDVPTPAPTDTPTYKRVFFEVTFDPNGGTRTGGGNLKQTIESGYDAALPTVEYENHRFVGWDASHQSIVSQMTIKAIWDAKYQVTFDMSGGSKTGGGDLVQTVWNGEGATAPLVERSGYTFVGWHRAFDKITEDTLVVALWERNPEPKKPEIFHVIYDINGGTGVTPVDTNEYLKGDLTLLTDGSGFEKEGYEFAGWSYEVNGEAITEEEITVENDVTLYAVWEESEEPAATIEPTTVPPVKEPDVSEDVSDIPKTGETSSIYVSLIMLTFGAGVVIFETLRRKRNLKADK